MKKIIMISMTLACAVCAFAQFGPGHDWSKGGGWTSNRSMPRFGGASSGGASSGNGDVCYCGPDEYVYDLIARNGGRFRVTYHTHATGEYHYQRWVYNRNGTLQLCERRISMTLPGGRS